MALRRDMPPVESSDGGVHIVAIRVLLECIAHEILGILIFYKRWLRERLLRWCRFNIVIRLIR